MFQYVQNLTLKNDPHVSSEEDTLVHDDLKREVAFYNHTLTSVRFAKEQLLKLNTEQLSLIISGNNISLC